MNLNEFKKLSHNSKKGDELIQSAPANTIFSGINTFRVIKSITKYEVTRYDRRCVDVPRSTVGCFYWFFDETTSIVFPSIKKPILVDRGWKILYNLTKRKTK